eukprot:gene16060-63962_t
MGRAIARAALPALLAAGARGAPPPLCDFALHHSAPYAPSQRIRGVKSLWVVNVSSIDAALQP